MRNTEDWEFKSPPGLQFHGSIWGPHAVATSLRRGQPPECLYGAPRGLCGVFPTPHQVMVQLLLAMALLMQGSPKPPPRITHQQMVVAVHKAVPGISQAEEKGALYILYKESGGTTNGKRVYKVYCRNPKSSSHGLNGFLRGTWSGITSRHGIRHSYDPVVQVKAMWLYVKGRYGSFARAAKFHRRYNYY